MNLYCLVLNWLRLAANHTNGEIDCVRSNPSAAMDVATDPRAPKIVYILEPETIVKETGLSWPHTSHCLGNGTIVIRFVVKLSKSNKSAHTGMCVIQESWSRVHRDRQCRLFALAGSHDKANVTILGDSFLLSDGSSFRITV